MKLGGEVSLGFFLVGAPVSSHPQPLLDVKRTRQAPPAPTTRCRDDARRYVYRTVRAMCWLECRWRY